MSLVKANTYQDASGGSNAVFSGVANPPNSMGFRNRIINGNMAIDQRNAGASVTLTADAYTLDRWYCLSSQTSKYSVQQNAGAVTPPNGFRNYLGVTSLSAYTVASGERFLVQQRIEGFNTADFMWGTSNAQTVTLSFWVRSSLTGTFGGAVNNAAVDRSYPFTYTVSAANTWEQKTVTIAGDTTGTWLTTNGSGLLLSFNLGTGSTLSGTAGAWAAGTFVSATGATSVVGTNGATFYITGVQLEAGTNASAFEQIDYGRELMMCQRYYEAGGATDASNETIAAAYSTSAARGQRVVFSGYKRAAPTMTVTSASIYVSGSYSSATTAAADNVSQSSFATDIGRSGLSTAGCYPIKYLWTASAEL
jgi:hypothetical protein